MTATLDRSSTLLQSLQKRFDIESEARRTGKTFRRHPDRMVLEKFVVKPLLHAGLRATGFYARGVRNALSPVVTRLSLPIQNLPSSFDGFRLLHLSDLHIDSVPGLPEALAGVLATLDADQCVMTGDYRYDIEGSCDAACEGMRTVLGSIRSRTPILATLGNHDPAEIAPRLEAMGVHMLVNDAFELRRGGASLWFAGIDDSYDYRCDDLESALCSVPPDACTVLLAHTPDSYDAAAAREVKLYLCGHTHAGQVRLPWIGSVIENSDAPRSYTHGYWQHRGMHGYTSSGLGCSMMPIRFNCPPEIVMIELRRAEV